MKSGKQRRAEIRQRRLERAKRAGLPAMKPWEMGEEPPPGVVAVDPIALAHNNTYAEFPAYYTDKAFVCRDCGAEDLWTAKQQKWWYEIAKGSIWSTALHCRACRRRRQARRIEARRVHVQGLVDKHGVEVASVILNLSAEEIAEILTPQVPAMPG